MKTTQQQLRVLLWKHWVTRQRSLSQNLQLFVVPMVSLTLCFLFYETFNVPDRTSTGWLELVFVPVAMMQLMNVEVITLVSEKSSRLLELMRIMSLRVEAYYAAHSIEAWLLGLSLALLSASTAAVFGLFNQGNWIFIFGLLWAYCAATTCLAFVVAACFDVPQTAGQVSYALQIAQIVVFFAIIGDDPDAVSQADKIEERLWSLAPTVGLELGVNSFRGPPTQSKRQYGGIDLAQIIVVMLAGAVAYVFLAAYLAQVVPSEFGAGSVKPWYFPFKALLPKDLLMDDEDEYGDDIVKKEQSDHEVVVRERPIGATPAKDARVVVRGLRKRFGDKVAVNSLDVDLFENQIFALLGHNGAGKTTAISCLTGILESDSRRRDGGATIYGHAIKGDMDAARKSIGMCGQHDVLFDFLSCREHMTFFARIKGASMQEAEAEADELLEKFRLTDRSSHLAHELSGGMRRKLCCALALCGRSKFVLLDEPTAGLDTLARRELWDLLLATKVGRTMVVSTHYMSEADVLGDTIGIMALGNFKCVGSSSFLKKHYGGGYRVVSDDDRFEGICRRHFEDDDIVVVENNEKEVLLPHDRAKEFPKFFAALDATRGLEYGLKLTTMEDVFLKVGADETVQPSVMMNERLAIGSGRQFDSNPKLQVYALAVKRFRSARHDSKTLGLLLLPIGGVVTAFSLETAGVLGKGSNTADLAIAAICAGGFLLYPAFVAENVVSEREGGLLNVLRVMGCGGRAYWIGTFLGDFALFSIVVAFYWLMLLTIAPTRWIANTGGALYTPPIFGVLIITYSYAISQAFAKAKRCIAIVPGIQILQLLAPQLILLIVYQIMRGFGSDISLDRVEGYGLWVLAIMSPQGAFWLALYNTANNLAVGASYAPRFYVVMLIMAFESSVFFLITLKVESRALRPLERRMPTDQPEEEDEDVRREAKLVSTTLTSQSDVDEDVEGQQAESEHALVVKRLRKVYHETTVAVSDLSFRVAKGECLGLLGANGAGKSTTISAIIRAVEPTHGDIFVEGHSVLDDFEAAATALGVVAQSNTLWNNLTCADHLELFARIRGVPNEFAPDLVDAALDQLELRPHADKLATSLSGGMKRKLCVAIAIIGDPQCVLLDEPSAGLDPVSRRNLWNLLRQTMSTRAVVLTSHLMDEVEALCDRVMILVRSKARCLGTIQHLVSTRGKHYEVSVTAADDADEAASVVSSAVPSAVLEDRHGTFLQYTVPWDEMNVGGAFQFFEDSAAIRDYSISQPSLESVFVRCVKEYSSSPSTEEEESEILSVSDRILASCGEVLDFVSRPFGSQQGAPQSPDSEETSLLSSSSSYGATS